MLEFNYDLDYLKSLALSENGFLFNTSTGQTYTLNQLGQKLLRNIQEGKKPSELLEYIEENYDVTKDEAVRDLTFFLSQLKEFGLLGV